KYTCIADRDAWTKHSRGSGFAALLDSIGKRVEGIPRDDASVDEELRLQHRDFHRTDAAHLSRTDRNGLAGAGEDDRVGLNVLAYFPAKKHCGGFFARGDAPGDHLQVSLGQLVQIRLLHANAAGDSLKL